MTAVQVTAVPASINDIEWGGVESDGSPDSRTADKLVDGENHTWDPEHMWLAPFTAGEAAKVTAQPGFISRLVEESSQPHRWQGGEGRRICLSLSVHSQCCIRI